MPKMLEDQNCREDLAFDSEHWSGKQSWQVIKRIINFSPMMNCILRHLFIAVYILAYMFVCFSAVYRAIAIKHC